MFHGHCYCEFLQLLYFITLTACDVQPTVLLTIKTGRGSGTGPRYYFPPPLLLRRQFDRTGSEASPERRLQNINPLVSQPSGLIS